MPRNQASVLDLQDAAYEVSVELGKVPYPTFIETLRARDLADAIPHLPAMRKVRMKYSIEANADGSNVVHYVEPIV